MSRPRLLDLFCGAGGCAVGYHRAGFDVVGVDHVKQPRFPFKFFQADALEYLATHGQEFDVIHASPPCQRFSMGTTRWPERIKLHPDLVTPTLKMIAETGKPFAVENVPRSPLGPFTCNLCGLMFGLKLFRHRRFATSHLIMRPHHPNHRGHRIGVDGMVCMAGHGDAGHGRVPADHRTVAAWRRGSGIDWMNQKELAQAIPPAYTEFIGKQLMRAIQCHQYS